MLCDVKLNFLLEFRTGWRYCRVEMLRSSPGRTGTSGGGVFLIGRESCGTAP